MAFERLKDAYLKHHVKTQCKNYYLFLGLDPRELEHKTLAELVELVTKLVEQLQKENESLKKIVSGQDKEIATLKSQNDQFREDKRSLQIRNEEMFDRNERLTQKLSVSMQHNIGDIRNNNQEISQQRA